MSIDVEAYGGSLDGKIVEIEELLDKDTISLEKLMDFRLCLEGEIYKLSKKGENLRLVYLGFR